ncbi:dihydrofolate reductase family protein [Streptomyces alboniger]|uniref:Dihydrofolate reductase n=1 Tax=Streptomyces alboniger TaxID=132473 RepID=A0A5J6HX50_STRAD|nr:dihydrofolate reductase family protein [Streptomyces alboniger]QEV21577.1 dihydrofolate reductase [Streptomyces alboniger]
MGKIIWTMSVSLDGFMEGPNREIDWHRVDDELHRHFNDWCGTLGAFLDGRVTWELMDAYWPTADQDPSCGEIEAQFAGIWRDTPKYVFSRTLRQAGWNTTILREVVPEEIRALKEKASGDLALGGADLAATFLRLGLIDEIHTYVHPVVIGRGKPMFLAPDVKADLRLAGTRTFGSGVVQLRHQLAGSPTNAH